MWDEIVPGNEEENRNDGAPRSNLTTGIKRKNQIMKFFGDGKKIKIKVKMEKKESETEKKKKKVGAEEEEEECEM